MHAAMGEDRAISSCNRHTPLVRELPPHRRPQSSGTKACVSKVLAGVAQRGRQNAYQSSEKKGGRNMPAGNTIYIHRPWVMPSSEAVM